MNGGFFFKHQPHIFSHGFPEPAVFAQLSVEGNQNRVVSFHIPADSVRGKREGYGIFQPLSLQLCFAEHLSGVIVQKTHRAYISVFCDCILYSGIDLHRHLPRFPVSERDRGNDTYAEHQNETRRHRRDPFVTEAFAVNLCLRIGFGNQPVIDLTDCVQQSFSFHK